MMSEVCRESSERLRCIYICLSVSAKGLGDSMHIRYADLCRVSICLTPVKRKQRAVRHAGSCQSSIIIMSMVVSHKNVARRRFLIVSGTDGGDGAAPRSCQSMTGYCHAACHTMRSLATQELFKVYAMTLLQSALPGDQCAAEWQPDCRRERWLDR